MNSNIPEMLPEGVKFFTCYFIALREYLRDEYKKAVGIAEAALMLGGSRYPVAAMLFRTGFRVKEVAAIMGLSVNTVKRHIAKIYQKTNSKKRSDLPKKIIR